MRTRDQLGMTLGPLILRVVIGVTFLWAGLGKVLGTMPVQGEYAAQLANIGVPIPGPELEMPPADDTPDDTDSDASTGEAAPAEGDASSHTLPAPSPLFDNADFVVTLAYFQDEEPMFTAADFPEPVQIRNLYGLAGMIHAAANPGLDEDSRAIMSLWPSVLAGGSMPVIFAWAAAVTEAAAGAFLILGLLTRLSALSTAGVMCVAMWLTQIGPALQAGTTQWGFMPAYDLWDAAAWTPFMWQFALLGGSMAIVFLGSGCLGLDRPLFGGSDEFARAEKRGKDPDAKGSREDTP